MNDVRQQIGAHFTWASTGREEFGEFPTWDQLTDEDQAYGLRKAEEVLADIKKAGFSVVPTEQVKRLQAECREILQGIYPEGAMYLEPGDLDPVVQP